MSEREVLGHEHDECCCGHEHEPEHEHHHEDECCCGHDHEHEHHHDDDCCCGHDHGHEHHHHHGGGCSCCAEKTNFDLHEKDDSGIWDEHKGDLIRLIIGAVLFAAGLIIEHTTTGLSLTVVLPICAVAYLILGTEVLKESFENIRHGEIFDENFLMAIATLAAFCIGDFPEAVGVMLFFRIGELFEDISVDRSRKQIAEAVDMRPETVKLVCAEDHDQQLVCAEDHDHHHEHEHEAGHFHIHEVDAADVKVGDIVQVDPGDRIPLDGIVISGKGQIDTSPITGEPVPRIAEEGTEVLSGCINMRGQIQMKVTAPLEHSMVSKILDSVENAQASKPEIEKFITKFAKIYTPIVVVLAVLVAVVPPLVTTAMSGAAFAAAAGTWHYWLLTAITFLVISCPCAMVISVPLAYFLGVGAASKQGILVKSGLALEGMRKLKAVAMDKTGTITKGVVEDTGLLEVDGDSSRQETFEEAFAKKTVTDDVPKDDAKAGIAAIKSMGLVPAMLTGDEPARAKAIADQVGIDEAQIKAGLLPDGKLTALQELRDEHGEIMFVGDGINDAPVLAGADVGAAMGAGADAAIEAADVVFMNSNVGAISQIIRIARKTGAISKQNIVMAIVIKLIVMALGLIGFANIWFAIFADTGVCMLCILNSIRLMNAK